MSKKQNILSVCLSAGDSRCFLFSVYPRLRVYTATGYNQHFMYLNQNQQTMPNGLVRTQRLPLQLRTIAEETLLSGLIIVFPGSSSHA